MSTRTKPVTIEEMRAQIATEKITANERLSDYISELRHKIEDIFDRTEFTDIMNPIVDRYRLMCTVDQIQTAHQRQINRKFAIKSRKQKEAVS